MSTRTSSLALPALGIATGVAVLGALLVKSNSDAWKKRINHAYRLAAHALEIEPPPMVISGNVSNAQSNGRTVAINLRWARRVLSAHCDGVVCNDQVLVGVLAHELAHHVYRHAEDAAAFSGTPWEKWVRHRQELEADRAAGGALRRLGLGAAEFARVLALLGARETRTHPAASARIAAVREGYLGYGIA